ncbi:alpha/beta hydrolase [Roseovarius spongiae]|uniref:Alpha/beta hydrolase n=1 Tax=Roseovarius spongiae TaxID=2320272 RepID=A0A3A8B8F2_9RHOB|nr:alpha/beta hydrolase [Roseovarius spongiae]RKF13858.1 alpha/beta hydrolase [Roseovarius spongiae]
MPKAIRGGFPTYWTTFGQGPREALLIHCSLAQSGAWGGMARRLSGALTMTAFDLPGHGRSGDWDGRGEIQQVTTGIAADFACAGPVDVIGHSFGGTVALRMAVDYPDRVRTLVLIEPVFFAAGMRADPQAAETCRAQEAAFDAAMARGDHETAAREFLGRWGDGAPWEDLNEAERAGIIARIPLIEAATPALYDDIGGLLAPGVLDSVAAPALLIEGSESPGIIGAVNDALAARLPRAERSVIGGAAHMAPISHPAQVSAEILRFLQQA